MTQKGNTRPRKEQIPKKMTKQFCKLTHISKKVFPEESDGYNAMRITTATRGLEPSSTPN